MNQGQLCAIRFYTFSWISWQACFYHVQQREHTWDIKEVSPWPAIAKIGNKVGSLPKFSTHLDTSAQDCLRHLGSVGKGSLWATVKHHPGPTKPSYEIKSHDLADQVVVESAIKSLLTHWQPVRFSSQETNWGSLPLPVYAWWPSASLVVSQRVSLV